MEHRNAKNTTENKASNKASNKACNKTENCSASNKAENCSASNSKHANQYTKGADDKSAKNANSKNCS